MKGTNKVDVVVVDSCKISTFLAVICLFSSYFFNSITFDDGLFQFQDNKVN